MSATNYTPISLYHTSTAGLQPDSANLVAGELALNIPDGKLYFKDDSNNIVLLASKETSSNVTSVSVVSANGFTGTVANPTTTPAITLTTSATGILKGAAGALVAASSGVDYAPATTGSSILYANGSGGFSSVTIGSNLTFAGGTLSATGGGSSGVTSFNTRTGAVSLLSSDVTNALGYTPPTPTGSGASGTWGISITGNANYATSAGSASSASYATSAGSATSASTATTATNLSGGSVSATTGSFSSSLTSTTLNMGSGSYISGTSSTTVNIVAGGSGNFLFVSNGNFQIYANGFKPGGGSWADSSDARLKENVVPLTGALQKLSALNPVSYEWKYDRENVSNAGFIAQEVETVFPLAISETDPTNEQKPYIPNGSKVKNIGWQNDMTAYLVAAIKELKAEVDALKAAK